MVNRHGLKMVGVKAVAGSTKGLPDPGYYSSFGEYYEIFYDRCTGEVWSNYQVSLGQNTWTVYDDPNVIKCGNAEHPLTMQEVADWVHEAVLHCRAVNSYA